MSAMGRKRTFRRSNTSVARVSCDRTEDWLKGRHSAVVRVRQQHQVGSQLRKMEQDAVEAWDAAAVPDDRRVEDSRNFEPEAIVGLLNEGGRGVGLEPFGC